jgi:hypothetical protein
MNPFVAIVALAVASLLSAPAQKTALIHTPQDFPTN